jgi:hypothetical protein
MPHELACVQQGHALPRQYRTKGVTQGMDCAPLLNVELIAQTLISLTEVIGFPICASRAGEQQEISTDGKDLVRLPGVFDMFKQHRLYFGEDGNIADAGLGFRV